MQSVHAQDVVEKHGLHTKKLKAKAEELQTDRTTLEGDWRTISRFMGDPRDDFNRFTAADVNGNQRRQRVLGRYDDTGEDALDSFVGGLFGASTNPAIPWYNLGLSDTDLAKFQPVKQWLEICTQLTRRTFEPPMSGFYEWMPEVFADGGLFGNGVMYHRHDPRTGRYIDRMLPLSENYLDINEDGDIIGNYRIYSAREDYILAEYGEDALKSGASNYKKGNDSHKHTLIHIVIDNPGFQEGRLGVSGKNYISIVILKESGRALNAGGMYEFPFSWLRLGRIRGHYARGMGQKALSTMKGLNIKARDNLRAGNMAADPMLLTHDEDVKNKLVKKPGNVIVGGMSRSGKPLAAVLDTSGNIPVAQDMINSDREQIRAKFLFNLFSILSQGRTGLSPEEFLAEEQRRLQLMGPLLTQIQGPFLVPIVLRRFAQMERMGQLPPAPPELDGVEIQVGMESAMAKAQKVADGNNTLRFLQGVGVAAQFDPGAADHINGDAITPILQGSFGAPASVLLPQKDVAARRAQKQALELGQVGLKAAETQATIDEKTANANALNAQAEGL